jgi:hypothetical protein
MAKIENKVIMMYQKINASAKMKLRMTEEYETAK